MVQLLVLRPRLNRWHGHQAIIGGGARSIIFVAPANDTRLHPQLLSSLPCPQAENYKECLKRVDGGGRRVGWAVGVAAKHGRMDLKGCGCV